MPHLVAASAFSHPAPLKASGAWHIRHRDTSDDLSIHAQYATHAGERRTHRTLKPREKVPSLLSEASISISPQGRGLVAYRSLCLRATQATPGGCSRLKAVYHIAENTSSTTSAETFPASPQKVCVSGWAYEVAITQARSAASHRNTHSFKLTPYLFSRKFFKSGEQTVGPGGCGVDTGSHCWLCGVDHRGQLASRSCRVSSQSRSLTTSIKTISFPANINQCRHHRMQLRNQPMGMEHPSSGER